MSKQLRADHGCSSTMAQVRMPSTVPKQKSRFAWAEANHINNQPLTERINESRN
jgi:hypothetical protein